MYEENFIRGNYSKGRIIRPLGVVLHHNYLSESDLKIQMTSTEPVISTGEEIVPASYHCVGWKDGRRTVFARDGERAWHAGTSSFYGIPHCNNFMLGYAFHGNTYAERLTREQIESFIEWFIPRMERFTISKEYVTDHRTVAPGRKKDLNPVELERVLTAINNLWL